MIKDVLISFLGNNDIKGISGFLNEKGELKDKYENSSLGPFLKLYTANRILGDIDWGAVPKDFNEIYLFLEDEYKDNYYKDNIISMLNRIRDVLVEEKNSDKSFFKNINFVDFKDKSGKKLNINDLTDITNFILDFLDHKSFDDDTIVYFNQTSGTPKIQSSAYILNVSPKLKVIDVLDREKKISIQKKDNSFFSKILESNFLNYFKVSNNIIWSGIESERKKADIFVEMASNYLSKSNNSKIFEFPLLIKGESGTGKEILFNDIIEKISFKLGLGDNFKKNKVRSLNCAVFSKELVASELFGHKKGAFTGAVSDKKGILDEVDGGVLFLDEFGELEPSVQSKFLRVLQDGSYFPIGGEKVEKSFFVLVTATNKEIENKDLFRGDLYFRVSKLKIDLPSLNDRDRDSKIQIVERKIEEIKGRFLSYLPNNKSLFDETFDFELKKYLLDNGSFEGNFRGLESKIAGIFVDLLVGKSLDDIFNKKSSEKNKILLDEKKNISDYSLERDISDEFLLKKISESFFNKISNNKDEVFNKSNFKNIMKLIQAKISYEIYQLSKLTQKDFENEYGVTDRTLQNYKKDLNQNGGVFSISE
ncbi:sigma 54-interacting transcriptional regulator [bacterium]|nr:sigma 54-interacting transcriptional regulator [bacterium]